MTRPTVETMSPFFVVSDVSASIAFYTGKLGFQTRVQEPDGEPFFAIIGRDGATLFLKSGDAAPLPNSKRDPAMRWDAYCFTPDPDALTEEFVAAGVAFSNPLANTSDGLRGFEITDPDGYVLFFGRPHED